MIVILLVIFSATLAPALGHGRLLDPPQRSSMWRFGFPVPENYNDMELYCGGFMVQWQENDGKCGECGDPWHEPRPRLNDEGGLYGTGIIGKNFTEGESITIEVELTVSHKGYFEFRLCKRDTVDQLTTHECLEENLLDMADGSGTRFPIPEFLTGFYYPVVKLPDGFTCEYCTLQWFYKTGNSWGTCEDGTSAQGCGPQETFVNCADISISPAV